MKLNKIQKYFTQLFSLCFAFSVISNYINIQFLRIEYHIETLFRKYKNKRAQKNLLNKQVSFEKIYLKKIQKYLKVISQLPTWILLCCHGWIVYSCS